MSERRLLKTHYKLYTIPERGNTWRRHWLLKRRRRFSNVAVSGACHHDHRRETTRYHHVPQCSSRALPPPPTLAPEMLVVWHLHPLLDFYGNIYRRRTGGLEILIIHSCCIWEVVRTEIVCRRTHPSQHGPYDDSDESSILGKPSIIQNHDAVNPFPAVC
jgi:hypothetical protein